MTSASKMGRPSSLPADKIDSLRTAYATLVRTGKPVSVRALAKDLGISYKSAQYQLFRAKDA